MVYIFQLFAHQEATELLHINAIIFAAATFEFVEKIVENLAQPISLSKLIHKVEKVAQNCPK
jgi:hypothetical protein